MSYRRAWLLIDSVNRSFRSPVVETQLGGTHGGGAALTEFGHDLITHYRAIERAATKASAAELAALDAAHARPRDHLAKGLAGGNDDPDGSGEQAAVGHGGARSVGHEGGSSEKRSRCWRKRTSRAEDRSVNCRRSGTLRISDPEGSPEVHPGPAGRLGHAGVIGSTGMRAASWSVVLSAILSVWPAPAGAPGMDF